MSDDSPDRCPTCGRQLPVVAGDDRTSYFPPDESDATPGRWNALDGSDPESPLIVPREDLRALQVGAGHLRDALETIGRTTHEADTFDLAVAALMKSDVKRLPPTP